MPEVMSWNPGQGSIPFFFFTFLLARFFFQKAHTHTHTYTHTHTQTHTHQATGVILVSLQPRHGEDALCQLLDVGQLVAHSVIPVEVVAVVYWAIAHAEPGGKGRERGGVNQNTRMQTDRQTHTYVQTDTHTYVDRQTHTYADRQTDTHICTDRHTHMYRQTHTHM